MIRRKIEDAMRKKRAGGAAHAALTGLSLVYGAAVRLRLFLYRAGVLRTRRLDRPVISIGNITAGGTGKTPMAIFLATLLKKKGYSPVILSRGYKKTGPGGIVSDGRAIKLGAAEAGDEPYLMARRLPDVPVIAAADRYGSGRRAVEKFRPACVILDDGFQHLRLARDLNILLIDSAGGLGNGLLLPAGPLREPPFGIRRADFIMVKGGELAGQALELARIWNIPAIRFDYRASVLYGVHNGVGKGVGFLKGKKALAFAGIADPASFFRTLAGLNASVVNTLTFPDHHEYRASDIELILKAKGAGPGQADIIVTTEKDGVKLKDLLKGAQVFALGVEVAVRDESRLEELLEPLLDRLG